MQACSNCGHENPTGSRFCNGCGAALTAPAAPAREERKLVTVLFADLVGFTSRSEQLDPEDVRAMLSPFYARLRTELESFGGTVEKFIGDAVMAVFGAPVAHEDDPERAVRAAIAIRDWVLAEQPGLQVRIAVNTGEALVTLGARPSRGEGMVAGDVVNTAARLQAAAPVNGILAGERTFRATRHVIEFRAGAPVTAKGKAEPVPAHEVVQARSRPGVEVVGGGAGFVGRERELALLRDALARVRDESSPQLVTLIGVPGMGKSRLVYELSRIADGDPDLITWRQGRSLPYGKGLTYRALAEILRGHCGILDTDAREVAAAKLADSVAAVLDDESVLAHLRPLVGLEGAAETGREHQAWRRFFEGLAARGPLVLVFEDLHWADDSLLDFVDHLVDWATGVPLLVVCTARPELLERRPAWGGGKRNASTLSLSPLSGEETARLLAKLSDRSVVSAELQSALLARVGGNPLYTEQFVRMLTERGDSDFPLPETVQGIIAARLDGLAAEEKTLLQSAAVFGKTFWRGAAAAVAGLDVDEVDQRLHALQRKEFVHRQRRSSVADETEYTFGHALVRDVAYGELPRSTRVQRHRAAAEWIESLGGADDHAEMLAHHYQRALESARAAGDPDPALEARARDALRAAGERTLALGSLGAAAHYFEAAAELTAADDPERPLLLLQIGRGRLGDPEREAAILEEAAAGLLAQGDRGGAAEAETRLARSLWVLGSAEGVRRHLDRALALIGDDELSSERMQVLATVARMSMLAGDVERAVEVGEQALAMAEQLGSVEFQAHAILTIGTARGALGDRGGLDDIRRAIKLTDRPGLLHHRSHARSNLSSVEFELGDLGPAIEDNLFHLREAEVEGDPQSIQWSGIERMLLLCCSGEWQESERLLAEFSARADAVIPYMRSSLLEPQARFALARGQVEEAVAVAQEMGARAREIGDPQVLFPALGLLAWALAVAGRRTEAGATATELIAGLRGTRTIAGAYARIDLAFTLLTLGRESEFAGAGDPTRSTWSEAANALLEHDFLGAAAVLERVGAQFDEARARLLAGERLLLADRLAEAVVQLERSAAFFRRVGASAYVTECEALLGRAAA